MEVSEEKRDGVLILRVQGRLDTITAPGFEDTLLAHIDSGQQKIAIDASKSERANAMLPRVW